jgi:hypothetical protein
VLAELFDGYYGAAAREVRAYLEHIDRAWTETPEFSGGGLGHARRFSEQVLGEARTALDRAKAACSTTQESERVAMLDESLAQLELYMKTQRAFHVGRLQSLMTDYTRWQSKAAELADRYAVNSAFGKAGWAGANGVYGNYVRRFLEPLYLEGDRIAREQHLLSERPSCSGSYRVAAELVIPTRESPPQLSSLGPTTNFCTDTWSTLRLDEYFGAMWYQLDVDLSEHSAGKAVFVWLSKLDGVAQAWLNGSPLPLKGAPRNAPLSGEAHLKSLTFDATAALLPRTRNRLTVAIRRTRLAELGAGGLLGPIYFYADR